MIMETSEVKLEEIKAKIKKQKIGTLEEIAEYGQLFDEYVKISAKISKKVE